VGALGAVVSERATTTYDAHATPAVTAHQLTRRPNAQVRCSDRVRRAVAVKLVLPSPTSLTARPPAATATPRRSGSAGHGATSDAADTAAAAAPARNGLEMFRKDEAARLRREAQATMRAASADATAGQHVCTCFESWCYPSAQQPLAFVMVMELCCGPSLAQVRD
jgi:hypothetical protein